MLRLLKERKCNQDDFEAGSGNPYLKTNRDNGLILDLNQLTLYSN